jgi:hypothetical protein
MAHRIRPGSAAEHRHPAAYRRPVYLLDGAGVRIRLETGPSLKVIRPGRPPERLPLAHVARIVSDCRVQWDSEGLIECLRHGVPVLFHQHGQTLAWCFGRHARPFELDEALQLTLDHPAHERILGDFFRSQERREMLDALKSFGIGDARLDPEYVRGRLCNRLRDRIGQAPGPILRLAELALDAVIAERLSDSISDPRLLAHYRELFNLPEAVRSVLAWRLPDLIRRGRIIADPRSAVVLRQVDGPGNVLTPLVGSLLRQLGHHLRNRLAEPWP